MQLGRGTHFWHAALPYTEVGLLSGYLREDGEAMGTLQELLGDSEAVKGWEGAVKFYAQRWPDPSFRAM